MPGLMDGNDAFFTFSAVFGSFTFTPDVETNETGGVDGPDRMVLFESTGSVAEKASASAGIASRVSTFSTAKSSSSSSQGLEMYL